MLGFLLFEVSVAFFFLKVNRNFQDHSVCINVNGNLKKSIIHQPLLAGNTDFSGSNITIKRLKPLLNKGTTHT